MEPGVLWRTKGTSCFLPSCFLSIVVVVVTLHLLWTQRDSNEEKEISEGAWREAERWAIEKERERMSFLLFYFEPKKSFLSVYSELLSGVSYRVVFLSSRIDQDQWFSRCRAGQSHDSGRSSRSSRSSRRTTTCFNTTIKPHFIKLEMGRSL